jgi:hypothetical protein
MCKAVTEQGKRCVRNGAFNGYCATHYNIVFNGGKNARRKRTKEVNA